MDQVRLGWFYHFELTIEIDINILILEKGFEENIMRKSESREKVKQETPLLDLLDLPYIKLIYSIYWSIWMDSFIFIIIDNSSIT